MFDYAHLTKSYKADNSPNDRTFDWRTGDQASTVDTTRYSPEFLKGYLLHYCRLCEKTNRQGTIPVLHVLLDIEPQNGEVHFMLARQYEMNGDRETAMPSFERAAALCPEKPEYTLAAVRAAGYLGDRIKAMSLVNSVIGAYPIMAEARYERAVIYEIDENWNRALQDFDYCHHLDPNNTDYLCDISRMYRMQKLFKLARQFAERALRIDPKCSRAHDELRLIPIRNHIMGMMFRNDEYDTSDAPWTGQRQE